MEQGATISTSITPKCNSNLKKEKIYEEPKNINIGDTINAAKEIISVQQGDKSNFLRNIEKQSTVDVFPNPFENTLAVKSSSKNGFSISIKDLHGRIVYENSNFKGIEELDLSHLKPGTYVVKFVINHTVQSKKIIKK